MNIKGHSTKTLVQAEWIPTFEGFVQLVGMLGENFGIEYNHGLCSDEKEASDFFAHLVLTDQSRIGESWQAMAVLKILGGIVGITWIFSTCSENWGCTQCSNEYVKDEK